MRSDVIWRTSKEPSTVTVIRYQYAGESTLSVPLLWTFIILQHAGLGRENVGFSL